MALLQARLAAQGLVKRLARSAGMEVRYAFQNPSVADPGVYARWLDAERVRTVLDVGANVGQSAQAFARVFPNATVHSFEPIPATYDRLRRLAEASGGRIKAYPLACGDEDGTAQIAVAHGTSQMNQVRAATDSTDAGTAATEIQVARLDTVCDEHGIDAVDILKTDTEGFDARVLAGAGQMLAEKRIRCVAVEVGFLDDRQHSRFDEVYPILTGHGYELAGVYEVSYFRDLACDFANALFVARDRTGARR